jgi:hypothetical protein
MRLARHADHLVRRAGRIDEGPEHVEHRAHAELAPHGADFLERRVIERCEEKREAVALELHARDLRRRVDAHARGFEHVGAAAQARRRAVAVLGDVQPAPRKHEARGGRHVDRLRAVAARAARVDDEGKVVLDVRARARIASAAPTTSDDASPLARAPEQARGLHGRPRPSTIAPIAKAISSARRSRPAITPRNSAR